MTVGQTDSQNLQEIFVSNIGSAKVRTKKICGWAMQQLLTTWKEESKILQWSSSWLATHKSESRSSTADNYLQVILIIPGSCLYLIRGFNQFSKDNRVQYDLIGAGKSDWYWEGETSQEKLWELHIKDFICSAYLRV